MAVSYNPGASPLLQPVAQQPGYATAYGTTYTPGQGQAPYASQGGFGTSPVSGGLLSGVNSGSVSSGATSGANSGAFEYGSQASAESLSAALLAAAPYGQGAMQQALANYNSGMQQAQQAASNAIAPGSNDGLTVIGQGQGWMSPEQLRNATNGIQAIGGGGGSSGGSGGASGGAAAGGAAGGSAAGDGSGGGLSGLGGAGNISTNGSTPGSLSSSPANIGATVPYQNPGSVNNTGVVGYNNGFGQAGAGQTGVLAMQPANAQNALDQYRNTAAYQNLNAPGAYQQSPGYQYAMDQAMGQVQKGAAGRGMLESGAVIKQMQQTASGLAQQDYGNWWNRQNQLYGDYQNRLQGLAGGQTGSADAMTAGANAAQGNLQTASNLGSLFGNQGTSGMGGIINTAAAQSGNMINAGQQQASVNAANQATQLAGATIGGANKGLF